MEKSRIARNAGVVGLLTLVSRVAGLIRDMAIANAFGTRLAADAFFVAFRIPNLLRRLFAEGALTVSFVPVFTETLKDSRDQARKVVDVSWTFLSVILIGITLLGVAVSPWLVKLTAWGFSRDADKFHLTVFLTRVMFPYIFLVSLAALAMGVLNSIKHFSVPAAASIFMNLGIILGAMVLTRYFDPPVLGLAIGVLIGGVLQLGCHFPVLWRRGFWPRFHWEPGHPAIKKIVGMMVPAAYGAAVYQFNVIAITLLASFLPEGSVSFLWYADRVMEFPLGIFAISVATVILPALSDHAAEKNIEALKETFRFGLRMIFFITLPAAGGLMILSQPIVRVLFQHGHFNEASAWATSTALIFFAIGLPFISGVRVTSNAFYSMQDSKAPMRAANLSVLVNFVLSLILMGPLKHNGLALAVSLASVFNFAVQLVDFRKKVGALGLRKILQASAKTCTAVLGMVLVLLAFSRFWPMPEHGIMHQVFWLGVQILSGVIVYAAAGFAMKMEEMRSLMQALRQRKARSVPPAVPPSGDASA